MDLARKLRCFLGVNFVAVGLAVLRCVWLNVLKYHPTAQLYATLSPASPLYCHLQQSLRVDLRTRVRDFRTVSVVRFPGINETKKITSSLFSSWMDIFFARMTCTS